MAGINLQSLISMGTQAAKMFGKNNGGILGIAGKAAQVWKEYQKYPQTPEGLKQAMAAHNLDASTIRNALNSLNPQMKKFIEDKLPGSLSLLNSMVGGTENKQDISTSGPVQNADIQALLKRARRK